MNLQTIIIERDQIAADIKRRREEFDTAIRDRNLRLGALEEAEKLIVFGLDVDRIARGRAVIQVQGKVLDHRSGRDGHGAGVRLEILADAKLDVALGAPKLRQGYFGAKNYEGFGDQRSDHPYWAGPRHGSIVFRIGLNRELADGELTPDQIEDALYFLSSLIKIEAALTPAKSA